MRLRHSIPLLIASLIVVAGLSSACYDSPTSPSGPLREQFELAPGATVTLSDGSARITFIDVTGDSRCPGDALCIQGGDALVNIEVSTSKRRQRLELHTGSMAPVVHDDLTIALVQLMPYPFSSLPPITPGQYRATLLVTRGR